MEETKRYVVYGCVSGTKAFDGERTWNPTIHKFLETGDHTDACILCGALTSVFSQYGYYFWIQSESINDGDK